MKEHCANVTNRTQISMQIFLSRVSCAFKTHDATNFVTTVTWYDRFSTSCRSESIFFECTQTDSTISANRPRLWKYVRARVLTSRHEDEIWMTQMKAFLSLVPSNVGSSVESRGLDSPLGAVPLHCCSATFPKLDVMLEELHKESKISRCDCKTRLWW